MKKPKGTKVVVQNGVPLIVDEKFKPSVQKLRPEVSQWVVLKSGLGEECFINGTHRVMVQFGATEEEKQRELAIQLKEYERNRT